MIVAGVTMRCRRQTAHNNWVKAANTARSAQASRGLLTWRRNTATSYRSTRISAFFDCALRASSPSQAMSCRKIRYSSRTATVDDHARWPLSRDVAGRRPGWPIRHPQALDAFKTDSTYILGGTYVEKVRRIQQQVMEHDLWHGINIYSREHWSYYAKRRELLSSFLWEFICELSKLGLNRLATSSSRWPSGRTDGHRNHRPSKSHQAAAP
jgi:hypothetical protein